MKLPKLTKIAVSISLLIASSTLPISVSPLQPSQAQQQLVAMADPSAMVIVCFRMSPRTTDADKQAVISFLSSQGLTAVGFKSNGYECTGQGTCATVMQMMKSQLYVAQLTLSNQMILAYRFDPLPTNPLDLKNKARFAYVAEAPGYGSGGNTAYSSGSGQSGQVQNGQAQYNQGQNGQGQYGQGQNGQGQYGQGQTGQGQYAQGQNGQGQYSQGQTGQGQYGQGQYSQGQSGQYGQRGQGQYSQYGQGQIGQGQYTQGQTGRGSQFQSGTQNGGQYTGSSQYPNGSQYAGSSQYGNGSQYASNSQYGGVSGSQYPNNSQFANNGQFTNAGANGQVQTSPFGNTTPSFNPNAPQWYPDPLKTGVNGLAPPSANTPAYNPAVSSPTTTPAYNPSPNMPAYNPAPNVPATNSGGTTMTAPNQGLAGPPL